MCFSQIPKCKVEGTAISYVGTLGSGKNESLHTTFVHHFESCIKKCNVRVEILISHLLDCERSIPVLKMEVFRLPGGDAPTPRGREEVLGDVQLEPLGR